MNVHKHPLLLIVLLAFAHAGFFIVYQQPDWAAQWSDQGGYHLLGKALAEQGRYTRFPNDSPYVPEAIRTPGYPIFVAAVYHLLGAHHVWVALAQAVVFAAICVLVYALGTLIADPQVARTASLVTALYPPLPYYGALILTEVWTTFLVTLSLWLLLQALRDNSLRFYAAAGATLAWAGLSRPAFILLPVFLAVPVLAIAWRMGRSRRALTCGLTLCVFGLLVLPWFAYNYIHFQRFTVSPAGGIGRSLWEGYWNGKIPGRIHAETTRLAENFSISDAELVERIRQLGGPTDTMIAYAIEWREFRRIDPGYTDPRQRVYHRVELDDRYFRHAVHHIRNDLGPYLYRRLIRGTYILWAGEIPIRYSDINRVPPLLVRAIWVAQGVLVLLAAVGLCARARQQPWTWVPLGAIVYFMAVHWFQLPEARYSLPLKPVVILLAVLGVMDVRQWARARGTTGASAR